MCPDLEWRVDDSAGEQTIAKTTPPRSPRWRGWAIGLVVMLGIGLGVMYRSIPEPAPRPTPTQLPTVPPSPTPPDVPAKLFVAINHEARALANGDVEAVIALHVPQDAQLTDWQRTNFMAWGWPAVDQPLYTIIDYNLRSQNKAWADIRQYRNGRWFRETRFYQRPGDRWLRSDPDPFFWSGEEKSLDTPHFRFTYAVEDDELLPLITPWLEEDYQSLCRVLNYTPTQGDNKMDVTLRGNEGPMIASRGYFVPAGKEDFELRFPSPRVTGIFETGRPTDADNFYRRLLAHVLTKRIAQIDMTSDNPNDVFFYAIQDWAVARSASQLDYFSGLVRNWGQQAPLPLDQLWWTLRDESFLRKYFQTELLIYFIEQEYNASFVTHLLKVLGSAKSMTEAIETGLGVPFAEFDQKWQNWIKQNRETGK